MPETNIEVTNIGASADVSVTKEGSPATVAQGAPVSFVVTVTNGSDGDAAEGVVLTDDLPAGLTWSLPEPVVDDGEGDVPESEVVEVEQVVRGRRSRSTRRAGVCDRREHAAMRHRHPRAGRVIHRDGHLERDGAVRRDHERARNGHL